MSHILTKLAVQHIYEVHVIIIPLLQIRKLTPEKIKRVAQGNIANSVRLGLLDPQLCRRLQPGPQEPCFTTGMKVMSLFGTHRAGFINVNMHGSAK